VSLEPKVSVSIGPSLVNITTARTHSGSWMDHSKRMYKYISDDLGFFRCIHRQLVGMRSMIYIQIVSICVNCRASTTIYNN